MKIKLDHINLTVQDMQESIEWYSKIFGFKFVESGIGTRNQPWAIVALNDTMIVMSEYKDRTKADQESETNIHKICHFGLRISESTTWEKTILENKLQLYYGGVVNYPFSRSWYIHDPTGHEIEISHTDGPELRFPNT